MKRRNTKLPPPFALTPHALAEWHGLQDEAGGTFRGLNLSEHKLWKLATLAEHAADWRRGRIDPAMRDVLRYGRAKFGLPAFPPPLRSGDEKALEKIKRDWRIQELAREGRSTREIAKETGVSHETARKVSSHDLTGKRENDLPDQPIHQTQHGSRKDPRNVWPGMG